MKRLLVLAVLAASAFVSGCAHNPDAYRASPEDYANRDPSASSSWGLSISIYNGGK